VSGSAVAWGDAPSWVAAVATVLTLLFAAVAAVAAHRIYRIESERDRLEAEVRQRQDSFLRRAQAALVSAWWGQRPAGRDGDGGRYGAFLRNASETPVYQAALTVMDINDPERTERFAIAVVPPANRPEFHPARLDQGQGDRRVEVTFTDSTGIRWIRDQRGLLSELRPEVVVWADTLRARPLGQLADDFLTTHGVRASLSIHRWARPPAAMVGDAGSADVPDVLLSPHDDIGYLAGERLIEPWTVSARRRALFVDRAIGAVTRDGELYALPYALDAPVLFRNTELAPHPPATVEELIGTGEELRAAGRVAQSLILPVGPDGEPFYLYPLLVGAGGWLFGRDTGGDLTTRLIGVASPESVAALDRFRELGKAGLDVLSPDIDEERCVEAFLEGRAPYLVSCSWALADIRRSGVPYGLSRIPPYAGHPPARPLVSVEAFFLIRHGANKAIAGDWVAYHLTRRDVALGLHREMPRPPALRDALDEVLRTDSEIAAVHRIWAAGDLMPSDPAMVRFWRVLAAAEMDLIAGGSPGPIAHRLDQSLRELFTD
jgi:arabinogalactan oligomer/maltooligosaccharide transport system substrate-binding protein